MASAQAPPNRPVWMIVLALAMALFGSLMLVQGLLTIRDPKALARWMLRDVAMTPSQEEIARKIDVIDDAIIARHRTAHGLNSGFSIAFGLWTLYATAALLSRDRNGRMLALVTAVVGTAYQLAVLPLVIGVVGETAAATGPLLAELPGGPGGAGSAMADMARHMVSRHVVSTGVGIGWWLLVFVYFGGRRGRELYGLPPR